MGGELIKVYELVLWISETLKSQTWQLYGQGPHLNYYHKNAPAVHHHCHWGQTPQLILWTQDVRYLTSAISQSQPWLPSLAKKQLPPSISFFILMTSQWNSHRSMWLVGLRLSIARDSGKDMENFSIMGNSKCDYSFQCWIILRKIWERCNCCLVLLLDLEYEPGFLNFSSLEIWDKTIHHCEELSCPLQTVQQHSWLPPPRCQ